MNFVRETVLLPELQYILSFFDDLQGVSAYNRNESMLYGVKDDHLEQIRKALDDFKSHYQYDSAYGVKITDIVRGVMVLIDCRDLSSISAMVREHIHEDNNCGLCVDCHRCLSWFWVEIGKRLLGGSSELNLLENEDLEDFIPSRALPERLDRHISTRMLVKDYYWEKCLDLKKTKNFNNRLIILKGLSSSTPALLNGAFNTHKHHGGGLYINWEGFGVAIDPGYHFMDTLHAEGLTVLDIDAVVITHEHIDHSNDVRILDDLNFSLKDFKGNFSDAAITSCHVIDWYVDSVTFDMIKTFQAVGSGFSPKTNRIFKIDPGAKEILGEKDDFVTAIDSGIEIDERDLFGASDEDYAVIADKRFGQKRNILMSEREMEVRKSGNPYGLKIRKASVGMRVIRTEHEKNASSSAVTGEYLTHTFSVSFTLVTEGIPRRTLYYTSDTRFTEDVCAAVRDADVVVANISSIYEEDLFRRKAKDTHLGYWGCYRIVNNMKKNSPVFLVVSEFWNGKTDIRFDITRHLTDEISAANKNSSGIRIIPAEIGMQIDMKRMMLRCSVCEEFSDEFIICRPNEEYGHIRCLCRKCFY